MPVEWLPMIWGDGDEDAAPAFGSEKQAEKLIGLIMEHYNAPANDLMQGRYVPVFDADPRNVTILWESGSTASGPQCGFAWKAGFDPKNGEEAYVALAGLITLAGTARGEKSLLLSKADDLPELAPDLIAH